MTVRVGLIGAGGVGARHARTLAGFGDVELVGICDPGRRRGRRWPASAGSPWSPVSTNCCRPDRTPSGCAFRRSPTAIWKGGARGPGCPSSWRSRSPPTCGWPSRWPGRGLRRAADGDRLPLAASGHRRAGTGGAGRLAVRLVEVRWWGATPPPVWWFARTAPAVRSSSRRPTCSTSSGCWPARWPRWSAARRRPRPGTRRSRRDRGGAALRLRCRRHGQHLLCPVRPDRGGPGVFADGVAV